LAVWRLHSDWRQDSAATQRHGGESTVPAATRNYE